MRVAWQYIGIVFLATIGACVDPIPFDTTDPVRRLVIFGELTQDVEERRLTISYSSRFGNRPIPVRDATAVLYDDEDNSWSYVAAEPGEYIIPQNEVLMEFGRQYHVVVRLANGAIYRSEPELLRPPVEISDVQFKVSEVVEVSSSGVQIAVPIIDISIDVENLNEGENQPYLRWRTLETWSFVDQVCGAFDVAASCYLEVPEEELLVPIFHSEDPNQRSLTDFQVFQRRITPLVEFNYRHYFNVNQYTISEEAYRYWQKVNQVSQPTGSIFDLQPGAVQGNIYREGAPNDLVLGYFEVSSRHIDRTFTIPQTIGIDFPQECIPFFRRFDDPDYCCFCSALPNQIPRPDYFDD